MSKQRRLFCEISPLTYRLSVLKCQILRHLSDWLSFKKFAAAKNSQPLPVLIYSHKSLIRRTLGKVDPVLQENKAKNLSLAAPKVSHILIYPGECFSFWKLVGPCKTKQGYKEGLTINHGQPSSGIGGGMCQFTNLLHWMLLHTPLQITEHHHHDGVDLFPDYGRQIPFGVGTSIMYNYLDYRFTNTTQHTFQLIVYTTSEYLCGELRADMPLGCKYHIKAEDEFFSRESDGIFRNNSIYRECLDVSTGQLLTKELIKTNHARVMYDTADLSIQSDLTADLESLPHSC